MIIVNLNFSSSLEEIIYCSMDLTLCSINLPSLCTGITSAILD